MLDDGSPNPFLDVRVREAANVAVNRKAIQDNLLTGTEKQPLYTGSTSFGYPSEDEIAAAGLMFDHDPERAKQLMAEAGYADGFDTTLHVVAGFAPGIAEMALAVQQDLGAIGIRLTIREYPASEYFTNSGVRGAGSGKTDGSPGIWWFFGRLPSGRGDGYQHFRLARRRLHDRAAERRDRGTRAGPGAGTRPGQAERDDQRVVHQTYPGLLHALLDGGPRTRRVTRADVRWPSGAVQPRGQEQLSAVQKLKA